ncbi:hypothetical protein SLA2020_528890 [Shorea laevis]
MKLYSSSSSSSSAPFANPNLTLFSPSQNPKRFQFRTNQFKTHHSSHSLLAVPPCSYSKNVSVSSTVVDQAPKSPVPEEEVGDPSDGKKKSESFKKVLVVRRPSTDVSDEESSVIDVGLEEFAKKVRIFEPYARVESGGAPEKRPLSVNLDLALYRAKLLLMKYRYDDAEKILEKCLYYWPEDGRPYVMLGKILSRQSKMAEARAVYERGCQATQGENPYIWQCWAVLENRMGNIRKARELFDAATVADKRHVGAWHAWAVLELEQGNVKKARQLLAKGLKLCGGNEYIYQTLALLEAKANRYDQARYFFRKATKCNPKSCPSWLEWAQLEVQQENYCAARLLFEKAVQASPKNRFAWQSWGTFEANMGNIDIGRKLLKIGHVVNPRDPVILQSLALLEYKHSTANIARVLFRRAAELDPNHQPVWMAWGWMEWKEGNIATAREYYQRLLSIDSTSENAVRCLQAWGVLEQRVGNSSAARRLFRSSISLDSENYVTWKTWAAMEEDQGNFVRADEIRKLYSQQHTEVVDDPSWAMGLSDAIDPALNTIKKLLNLDQNSSKKAQEPPKNFEGATENSIDEQSVNSCAPHRDGSYTKNDGSRFNLDAFIRERLSLDPSKLDDLFEASLNPASRKVKAPRRIQRLEKLETIFGQLLQRN